ncbi:hypothetical protein CAPTEDRAFT_220791 [Capitella teleta]|uniref:C-type lectin domain-containing protein n=1 Tax=Capitella teleta TaxID=283909 RepID=R7TI05_CAPTE|nr:hypothetical protein CAPTEDRAFT_220791 [Capitella teleta]|eukprot:ELT93458.1 hypothetical protein CAPTEDRAFT_220791 [Capitella teleta]
MKLLLALLMSLGFSRTLQAARCPAEWTPIADHCYQLSENGHSLEAAKKKCEERGGNLTDSKDEMELASIIVQASKTTKKKLNSVNRSTEHREKQKYFCKKKTTVDVKCEAGWHYDRIGRRCYMLNEQLLSWDDARTQCMAINGDLASVTSTTDQEFIRELITNATSSGIWIGGNEIDQTAGWTWTDGSPFDFFYWLDGKPDDLTGPEWCIEVVKDSNTKWDDAECSIPLQSICKKRVTCHEELISGEHYVMDWAFYATSVSEDDEAHKSRLDSTYESGGGGWTATGDDFNPYLSFAFTSIMKVISVVTQGHASRDEWVTKFIVSYSLTHEDLFEWEFEGNTDRNGKVENTLSESGILAKVIRIHTIEHHEAASMRVELLGCLHGVYSNKEALVSGDIFVHDEKITASSQFSEYHGPERARFDTVREGSFRDSWYAREQAVGEWIQVEFSSLMIVEAVRTRGTSEGSASYWVGSFEIHFSDDGQNWEAYQEPYGTVKVHRNNNSTDQVEHYLQDPKRAKFVRLLPLTWNIYIAISFEVFGSHYSECSETELMGGNDRYWSNGEISASSQLDDYHGPHRSRLNEVANGDLSGGWVPLHTNDQQWIQVNLGSVIAIKGVAIQGQHHTVNFVTEFYVSYSEDMDTWSNHMEPEDNATTLFHGNMDSSHIRRTYFMEGFSARGVRLHPTAWNNNIGIRWDLIGCRGRSISYYGLPCLAKTVIRQHNGSKVKFNLIGYPYAGVQYSSHCYCGTSYGTYGPTIGCNFPCTGDVSQRCGGFRANGVMTTGLFYKKCPDHWTAMGDNCYRVFTDQRTWEEAGNNCTMHGVGAQLASVNSIEEQQFVEEQLHIFKRDLWIGLTCHNIPYLHSSCEWSNGERVIHTNWAQGEPNLKNRNDHCVLLNYSEESESKENGVPVHAMINKMLTFVKRRRKRVILYLGLLLMMDVQQFEQSFVVFSHGERSVSDSFWTDLSNMDDISTFKFSNGLLPEELYWAEDQPSSNVYPTPVITNASDYGHWENVDENQNHPHICEHERVGFHRRTTVFTAASDIVDNEMGSFGQKAGNAGMSSGAVAGVVLGMVFVAIIVAFVGTFVYKRRLSSNSS